MYLPYRPVALVTMLCLSLAPAAHADVVTDWNARTMLCVGGNPVAMPPIPPGRGGPTGLLDIALAQAAAHDAVQAIQGRFEAYHYQNPDRLGLGSPDAAVAAAVYGVLVGLYGAGHACLTGVPDPAVTYAGDPGLIAGNEAAQAMLPLYRPAFLTELDPFTGGTEPGQWRPTDGTVAGANIYVGRTKPFTLRDPRQFRPEPAPPLKSQHYWRDYDEVKRMGSLMNSDRTAEQTDLARFWGNFPGQWYGALRGIADAHLHDVGDSARLFALAALAAADSQITVYETKYQYNFWRPETAIRLGDSDGNPRTVGDPDWKPFLQTPPYPDHSSGANNVGGVFTTILELFFGTDQFEFSVSSTATGLMTNPRQYHRFSQAADEIVDVRVWQGIHWRFADEDGREQGTRVGHWVFQKFLRPVPGTH
ncbi:MAG TPA: vanadium-dependent haloperoxidase [Vicinamibacterales bacterium]|nr:vanadium-dependent haloperoxidase [Vicinamibacterales bacterium]